MLCHGYINKLQATNAGIENPVHAQGNAIPYYVEENERLLNLLITNCEPILSEITQRIDQFNTINQIWDGFQELHSNYLLDSGEGSAMLAQYRAQFSVKQDVHFAAVKPAKLPVKKTIQKNAYSLKTLKNNYLGLKPPQAGSE